MALLTDFGTSDAYVGVMKGVIAGRCPGVTLIDLTHDVPPQDVQIGALQLDAAWSWFPEGTVFVCVVDPGVGSTRRAVVARAGGRLFVGPDNGLFSLLPDPEIRLVDSPDLPLRSRTFHGRDLFAPVAADLAAGAPFDAVGPLVEDPVRFVLPGERDGAGEVLLVDRYGNAITSVAGRDHGVVEVVGRVLPVLRAYADVAPGEPLALTGSTGRLELSVRNGDAAAELGVTRGTTVCWRPNG